MTSLHRQTNCDSAIELGLVAAFRKESAFSGALVVTLNSIDRGGFRRLDPGHAPRRNALIAKYRSTFSNRRDRFEASVHRTLDRELCLDSVLDITQQAVAVKQPLWLILGFLKSAVLLLCCIVLVAVFFLAYMICASFDEEKYDNVRIRSGVAVVRDFHSMIDHRAVQVCFDKDLSGEPCTIPNPRDRV
jgi:hypothetical protein